MEVDVTRPESSLAPELYFLIAKFLSEGPCRAVADVLKAELERAKILPQRIDWLGNEHNQSFQELERKYSHIGTEHLLQICSRIGPVLEKEVPPCVPGAVSLLGAGRQSLLRTKEDMLHFFRNISSFSTRFGGKPLLNPPGYSKPHSFVKILQGRENSGPLSRRDAIPSSFYSKLQLYRHTLGHLSAVYCVLYDRTGQYIITGADDLLVKVWSSTDGRLLATFRGASSEIMDIAVNFDNTLLAAGSLDKILRVWCFQTMSPIAVLSGHSGMITSVNFCPVNCNGVNYLVSTSSDGSVAFWAHSKKENERVVFQPKPIQYHEKMRPGQAQMICASFSPGGAFVAAGSADHHVRVYMMTGDEGPKRVLEVEAHSDTVDSIQWAHSGLKFISGSKDGTANIWNFEQQQWQSKILIMTTKLAGDVEPEEDSNKKMKVTMVCWDVSDEWVVTAVNDNSLKVWNSKTAELVKILRGHKDEVFVLESHPIDPRIILSAGHDGQLIVWDVLNNKPLACFQNFIEGQGNGAVFDAKWSPDGTMLAATDSHGHLMMYGFGSNVQKLKIIPKELFFHTDYRPLIRDANNYVLDEQTQTAPHLMPPPFLVDVDGNPYPPTLQRLVPGRENCRGDELVPNIAVGASGQQEVIEGIPQPEHDGNPRSNIDRLIEQLAQRQHIEEPVVNVVDDDNEEDEEESHAARQEASPRAARPGLRRDGDVEGVRQSSGNWQRDNTTPWNKPILVRPLKPALLSTMREQVDAMADMEVECYKREMRKRPQVSSAATQDQNRNLARNKRNRARHGYRTRAAREEEQEEDEAEDPEESNSSATSNESSSNEEPSSDSSSDDTSSEYSDWVADHGEVLEPPKRSKRKPVQKRPATPPSDSDRRRSQRPKKKASPVLPQTDEITEVAEIYRPPEWLSEVIPRKAPYYPQMGDEIVYFRQGHKKYLDAVRSQKIYEVNRSCEPWAKLNLKAQEFVKVIGIKYEIRPPRLCCLKLAQMAENGHMTGKSFTIKYHDIPNVLDFLVLRQTYENALQRDWTEGDRFRCMIEDGWWMGKIISFEPISEEFPDSYFMCFKIQWDNGEQEPMSPWDLEPIDGSRVPTEVGGSIPILPEEIQETLYQPQSDEWPMGDREETCRRIIRGLDQVMTLAIAEPFLAPVDLNIYPAYAYTVEYPIDLSTIKARFENRFYRRILSAQFDVRYLATNAEKFNERHSQIVKQARLVTDICLRIIRDNTEYDVPALYHELVDAYHSSDSSGPDEVDVENDIDQPSTSSQRPKRKAPKRTPAKTRSISSDWRVACHQILEELWQCEDSTPFREPVDSLEFPNYHQVIDTPMDLQTVKEDLRGGNYESPTDFAKDVRLIFTNSKNFNTNARSKIYAMTVRLSSRFEELIKQVINKWRSATRATNSSKKSNTAQKSSRTRSKLTNGSPKKSPAKKRTVTTDDDSDDNEEVPSENDEDDVDVDAGDDENDNDDNSSVESTPRKRVTRQINFDEPGPSTMTNGHSKRLGNANQRPARSRNATKRKFDSNSEDDTEDDKDATASSSECSEASDEAPMTRTRSGRLTTATMNGHESDSDESFEPSSKGKQTRTNRAKNSTKTRPHRTVKKQCIVEDDDDDDDDDNDNDNEEEEKDEDEDFEGAKVEEEEEEDNDDENDEVAVSNTRSKRPTTRNAIHETSEEEDEENYVQENNEDTQEEDENELGEVEVGMPEAQENYDEEDEEEDNDETASSTNESTENNSILDDVSAAHSYARQSKRKYQDSDNSESNGSLNVKHNPRRAVTKRRRYNEDSDDDDDDDDDEENYCENSQDSISAPSSRGPRRRNTKRPYYNEASDEESSKGDKKLGISVSSRGRVRKMTERAMSAMK